jgi:hypothetical protein
MRTGMRLLVFWNNSLQTCDNMRTDMRFTGVLEEQSTDLWQHVDWHAITGVLEEQSTDLWQHADWHAITGVLEEQTASIFSLEERGKMFLPACTVS